MSKFFCPLCDSSMRLKYRHMGSVLICDSCQHECAQDAARQVRNDPPSDKARITQLESDLKAKCGEVDAANLREFALGKLFFGHLCGRLSAESSRDSAVRALDDAIKTIHDEATTVAGPDDDHLAVAIANANAAVFHDFLVGVRATLDQPGEQASCAGCGERAWIPSGDRKPDCSGWVEAFYPSYPGTGVVPYFYEPSDGWDDEATHWKPLSRRPQPTETKGGGS